MTPLKLILLLFAIVWGVPIALLAAGVLANVLGLFDAPEEDTGESEAESGDSLPLCEAIGRIEDVWGDHTKLGDCVCGGQGPPFKGDMTTAEWMEFVEAAHSYVDATDREADDDHT